jgi:hypothetical protein
MFLVETDALAQIEMEILRFLAQIVMNSWKLLQKKHDFNLLLRYKYLFLRDS